MRASACLPACLASKFAMSYCRHRCRTAHRCDAHVDVLRNIDAGARVAGSGSLLIVCLLVSDAAVAVASHVHVRCHPKIPYATSTCIIMADIVVFHNMLCSDMRCAEGGGRRVRRQQQRFTREILCHHRTRRAVAPIQLAAIPTALECVRDRFQHVLRRRRR